MTNKCPFVDHAKLEEISRKYKLAKKYGGLGVALVILEPYIGKALQEAVSGVAGVMDVYNGYMENIEDIIQSVDVNAWALYAASNQLKVITKATDAELRMKSEMLSALRYFAKFEGGKEKKDFEFSAKIWDMMKSIQKDLTKVATLQSPQAIQKQFESSKNKLEFVQQLLNPKPTGLSDKLIQAVKDGVTATAANIKSGAIPVVGKMEIGENFKPQPPLTWNLKDEYNKTLGLTENEDGEIRGKDQIQQNLIKLFPQTDMRQWRKHVAMYSPLFRNYTGFNFEEIIFRADTQKKELFAKYLSSASDIKEPPYEYQGASSIRDKIKDDVSKATKDNSLFELFGPEKKLAGVARALDPYIDGTITGLAAKRRIAYATLVPLMRKGAATTNISDDIESIKAKVLELRLRSDFFEPSTDGNRGYAWGLGRKLYINDKFDKILRNSQVQALIAAHKKIMQGDLELILNDTGKESYWDRLTKGFMSENTYMNTSLSNIKEKDPALAAILIRAYAEKKIEGNETIADVLTWTDSDVFSILFNVGIAIGINNSGSVGVSDMHVAALEANIHILRKSASFFHIGEYKNTAIEGVLEMLDIAALGNLKGALADGSAVLQEASMSVTTILNTGKALKDVFDACFKSPCFNQLAPRVRLKIRRDVDKWISAGQKMFQEIMEGSLNALISPIGFNWSHVQNKFKFSFDLVAIAEKIQEYYDVSDETSFCEDGAARQQKVNEEEEELKKENIRKRRGKIILKDVIIKPVSPLTIV